MVLSDLATQVLQEFLFRVPEGKDSGGVVLTSVIGEAEYSSYGKEAATKTRPRDIEAVGNRATGRNHY
jgi:hypothetical protein